MFWSRELVCRRAVALMSDYLDGVLDEHDRVRLEAHLVECPHCTEYLAQLRRTIVTVGRIQPDELDPAVLDELVGVYRRWSAG